MSDATYIVRVLMYKFKPEDSLPIYSWIPKDELEQEAANHKPGDDTLLNQMHNMAKLPFAFHHLAQMPDGHLGYGASIGAVLATKGVVVPNLIGVDIGCGMCALRTDIKAVDFSTDELKAVMGDIRQVIPVGFKHNKHPSSIPDMHMAFDDSLELRRSIVWDEEASAKLQIGTLGGGRIDCSQAKRR